MQNKIYKVIKQTYEIKTILDSATPTCGEGLIAINQTRSEMDSIVKEFTQAVFDQDVETIDGISMDLFLMLKNMKDEELV